MEREEAIRRIKAWNLDSDDREVLEAIIPELAESGDEKINRAIFKALSKKDARDVLLAEGIQVSDALAYLEKQKEQKPSTPKFRVGDMMRTKQEAAEGITDGLPVIVSVDDDYYICNNEKIPITGQEEYEFPPMNAEQKPAEWNEEDSDNLERVDNYLWMLDNYVGDDCATPQGKADKIRENIQEVLSPWLKFLPKRFNLQPKQEWNEEDYSGFLEEDKKYMEKYIPLDKATLVKLLAERDRNIAESLESFTSVEQEKQEWSEEDEKMKESIIKALYGGGHFAYEPEITWLNFLSLNRKKMNEDVAKLCSNEWSEEDERKLQKCIKIVERWEEDYDIAYAPYSNMLKSLRPQPKQEWSEEDEKDFWGLTAYIPEEELKRLGITRLDILKKLKSIRPIRKSNKRQTGEDGKTKLL